MRDRWPEVRIADVADLIRGVTYAKDDARSSEQDGYVPVLRATNIQAARLVLDSELVFIPEANVSATQKLRAGDIVVATSSGSKHLVGKSALLGHDWGGSFGAFCAAIRPAESVDPRYLASFLQSPSYWKQIGEKSMGVNINNLRRGDIESVQLPLPDLDEQRRIVAEIDKQFSRLDEAVANLQRVKANLKRYKAAVLKSAVEGRLVETEASIARREGRGYETSKQLLQRVLEERHKQWSGRGKYKLPQAPVDTDADLPEGWVWASIDQLAEVGTGATPSRSNPAFWTGGDIPWVSSSVVNADQVTEATEFVSEQALAETNLTLYAPGTLLLAMYGEGKTRGKCTELRLHATTNQALAALQASADVRSYLRHFLDHNYEEMRKVASGGVQPNLNLSLVRSVYVPLPPAAEQVRISAEIDLQLTTLRGVEAEVDDNLKRAEALRQATLGNAFTQ